MAGRQDVRGEKPLKFWTEYELFLFSIAENFFFLSIKGGRRE